MTISSVSTDSIDTLLKSLISLGLGVGSLCVLATPSQAVQPSQTAVSEQEELVVYGQAEQPDQLGQGYIVFEQHGDTVLGAYYYPRSEFQCFVGKLNDNTEVVSGVVLSSMQQSHEQMHIGLSSLFELNQPSENDQRMVADCKQSVARQIQSNQLPSGWDQLPSALLR